MLIINMSEPLIPRLQSPFLQRHDGLTEPTPKPSLAVPAHPPQLTLLSHVFSIFDRVDFVEVDLELLTPVEDLATLVLGLVVDLGGGVGWLGGRWTTLIAWLSTFPGFDLPVHGIFVTLPVVFAAEPARAIGVGAAVRPSVPFFMFTMPLGEISS